MRDKLIIFLSATFFVHMASSLELDLQNKQSGSSDNNENGNEIGLDYEEREEGDYDYDVPITINFNNDQGESSNNNNNNNELSIGDEGVDVIVSTGLEVNANNQQSHSSNNNENSNVINLFNRKRENINEPALMQRRLEIHPKQPLVYLRLMKHRVAKRSADGEDENKIDGLKISISNSQSNDSNSNKNSNTINISGGFLARKSKATTSRPPTSVSRPLSGKKENSSPKPIPHSIPAATPRPQPAKPQQTTSQKPKVPVTTAKTTTTTTTAVQTKPTARATPRPTTKSPVTQVTAQQYSESLTTPAPQKYPSFDNKLSKESSSSKPHYEYLDYINHLTENAAKTHSDDGSITGNNPAQSPANGVREYTFNLANNQSNASHSNASNIINLTLE